MAGLTNQKPGDTYKGLLRVDDDTDGIDATLEVVTDGEGTESPLKLSTTGVNIAGQFAAAGTSSAMVDFGAGDATPSVANGNLFRGINSTQTINTFDDGVAGQIITVVSRAALTFDFNASNLKCGTADIVTASGDATQWVYDGTNWYLLSWMDVNIDLSSGGF
jgi:hypothetical protein